MWGGREIDFKRLALPMSGLASWNPNESQWLEAPGRADVAVWVYSLKTQARFLCCCPEVKFSLFGAPLFVLKAFNWLGESHPQHALLQVH